MSRVRRPKPVRDALLRAGLPRGWFTKKRTACRASYYRQAFHKLTSGDQLRAARLYGLPDR